MHTIMTLQVYPMEIIPRPSLSQADIQQASPLENNAGQLGNGFSRQFSRMEADEQSFAISSNWLSAGKPNKEWIVKNIQEGSICCYPKGDIDVRLLPIAGGDCCHKDFVGMSTIVYRKLAEEVSL